MEAPASWRRHKRRCVAALSTGRRHSHCRQETCQQSLTDVVTLPVLPLAMARPVPGRDADAYLDRRCWPLAPPPPGVRMLGFAGHLLSTTSVVASKARSSWQTRGTSHCNLQLCWLPQTWGSAWVRVERTEACVPTDQLQHSGEQPLCSSLVPPPPLPPPPTCT